MTKKLYRSNRDSAIAGVCGGLGEYFGIDSTIVRLIWLALIFFAGTGLLLYIVAAIVIPKRPKEFTNTYEDTGYSGGSNNQGSVSNSSGFIFGMILVVLGIFFILKRFIPLNFVMKFLVGFGWPVFLIVIGLVVIITSFGKNSK